MRRSAALYGRTIRFGVRLRLIVRETEKEAWAAADDLIRYVTDDAIAAAQKTFGTSRDFAAVSKPIWRSFCWLLGARQPKQLAEMKRQIELFFPKKQQNRRPRGDGFCCGALVWKNHKFLFVIFPPRRKSAWAVNLQRPRSRD